MVDYVEIPFEYLVHDPSAIKLRNHLPIVLHCASLSIAGNVPPDRQMVEQLTRWISETRTPWLGEHLAYVRADGVWKEIAEHIAFSSSSEVVWQGSDRLPEWGSNKQGPFNVGYTVSPQYSIEILERVLKTTKQWQEELGLPVLLENGPMYFDMPGSTMSQFEFISELCGRSSDRTLLLDLAHLVITSRNSGVDPFRALRMFPLDRVIEVHLSGTKQEAGVLWDDHSAPVPEILFDLLEQALQSSNPRAITLEYNWDSTFPPAIVEHDIGRIRASVERARSLTTKQ